MVRVEVQTDQLVVQLASTQKSKRGRPSANNHLHVPWHKTSSVRRREILLPDNGSSQTPDARPIRSETRATLVASIAHGRAWLDEMTADPKATTESIAKRAMQPLQDQQDDLARVSGTRARQSGHRRHAPARHGRRPAVRSPRRMVTPAPSARPRRSITALSNGSPHRTCLFPGKRDLGSTPPRISLSSAFLTHPPHKQLCHLHVIAHFPLSLSMGVFLLTASGISLYFCSNLAKCATVSNARKNVSGSRQRQVPWPRRSIKLYRTGLRSAVSVSGKRDLTTGENVGRKACRMEFAVSRE